MRKAIVLIVDNYYLLTLQKRLKPFHIYGIWVSNWRHQVFYGWSEEITSHDILTLHLNDSTEGRLKWLYVVGRVSERAVDDAQAEWIKSLPTSRVKSAVAVIAEDWGGCNNKVVDESIRLFVRSDSDIVFPYCLHLCQGTNSSRPLRLLLSSCYTVYWIVGTELHSLLLINRWQYNENS